MSWMTLHIETSQVVCRANHLTGFLAFMMFWDTVKWRKRKTELNPSLLDPERREKINLKLVSAIFCFCFLPNDSLRKLWKAFFMSPKKLYSFKRYASFCISHFPVFSPVSYCSRGWFIVQDKL